MTLPSVDLLILSNGPGEVTTWVKPVVRSLRQQLGNDRDRVRISVVLSPCANATGQEAEIVRSYPEVDRVQAAHHFFPFLLWGQTAESWEWRDRGVVIFLGGDQFFPVVIGKRLGYRTVIYGEWDARWPALIDHFGVMKADLVEQAPPQYRHKFTVIGDLMADVAPAGSIESDAIAALHLEPHQELIGILPGSKAAKLAQGVPLTLAIAERIHAVRPQTRFVIPVAPTLDLPMLAKFADPAQNPVLSLIQGPSAQLVIPPESDQMPYLKTEAGLKVQLWTPFPAHTVLAQCQLCLTTVGANTAELGSLAVPMVVLLPTQQLDAMRAWDGLPGILANLPGVGSVFAKLINGWFLRKKRLLAWPNIWAGREIVPELVGQLQPQEVADLALDWLNHPEKRQQVSQALRSVRGEGGAAQKLAQIVVTALQEQEKG